jgi:hypothetical protein
METVENLANLLMSKLTFTESVPNLIIKDSYEYDGTISKILKKSNKATKVYFKGLPSRCFWWDDAEEFPYFGSPGKRVNIIYQEIKVKTYSHFWIREFKSINENGSSGVTKRKKLSQPLESPKIKCDKCEEPCSLVDFEQCNGIISKSLWNINCNLCNSQSDDRYIGKQCLRETMICKFCGTPREI